MTYNFCLDVFYLNTSDRNYLRWLAQNKVDLRKSLSALITVLPTVAYFVKHMTIMTSPNRVSNLLDYDNFHSLLVPWLAFPCYGTRS